MELDFLYAGAKAKLLAKLKRLASLEGLALSDFGTRRLPSFLWQEWVVQAMAQVLGERFVVTDAARAIDMNGSLEAAVEALRGRGVDLVTAS